MIKKEEGEGEGTEDEEGEGDRVKNKEERKVSRTGEGGERVR